MSITEVIKIIKRPMLSHKSLIIGAILIILTSVSSFYLGVLSVRTVSEDIEVINNHVSGNDMVVASKNGRVYFVPWCGSADNILEENKVWFASEREAQAAGYMPASACRKK